MHISRNPSHTAGLGLLFRPAVIANDLMSLGQQIIGLHFYFKLHKISFLFLTFFFDI